MRSENQWIVLNKRVSDNTRVRYECSQCHWKNEELPYDTSADLQRYLSDDKDSYYYSSSANTSPSTSTHGSTKNGSAMANKANALHLHNLTCAACVVILRLFAFDLIMPVVIADKAHHRKS
ncbi:hypothetical protein DFQ28_003091 [Apophysomyces sp. BC1034]|nr:hypothetical protein DFQ28_003091 [Apophysomyces sp. BC1034]